MMLPVFSEGGTRCLAKFVEWFLHIFARAEAWVLTGGSGAVPLTALKANTSVFNLMRAIPPGANGGGVTWENVG